MPAPTEDFQLPKEALFNGAPVPDLSRHRGLQYGDGVFRTCFIYQSHVIDLEKQLELLSSDAARLDLSGPPMETLIEEALALAAGQDRAVLKVLLLRAQEERGYRSAGQAADRLLCRYPAPAYPASCWDRGVTATKSAFRLATQPVLAGVKHLNRLEQVLASRNWPAGVDEVLLSDEAGRPIGGTRTNLFWVDRAGVHTPSLERCGVAGHMRRRVLALAASANQPVRVADAGWDEVESALEVFLTNSLIGIWPVARLGERSWLGPGPVTRQLMQRLGHPRLTGN